MILLKFLSRVSRRCGPAGDTQGVWWWAVGLGGKKYPEILRLKSKS